MCTHADLGQLQATEDEDDKRKVHGRITGIKRLLAVTCIYTALCV